jgi:hypothetical protein
MDVGDDADVSKVQAESIFKVEKLELVSKRFNFM